MKSFEDLEVWKSARIFTKDVYTNFENCRDFSFKDQIQRASISILNNIAEGHERGTVKEFIRFLYISKGSCGEVRSMLILAIDLKLIIESEAKKLIEQANSISRQLSGFIKYLSKELNK